MKLHNVQNVDFEGSTMVFTVDGQTYRVELASISERLAQADETARRSYKVSPSGYGIHWPMVDEDLTVAGLISAATGVYPKSEQTLILNDKNKT
jgi:hypothetical protein